jgi:hypothetical protein
MKTNYLANPKTQFDPDYSDSHSASRKKGVRGGASPTNSSKSGSSMKNELVNLNNYYEYEESNDIYEPMVQPFSYFYVGIAG